MPMADGYAMCPKGVSAARGEHGGVFQTLPVFEGIETEYNDYGNHWIDLDPQYTDVNGEASIERYMKAD